MPYWRNGASRTSLWPSEGAASGSWASPLGPRKTWIWSLALRAVATVRAEPLPSELVEARNDVGRALGLGDNWLNAGPTDLLDFGLPAGFEERVETRRYGGLVLNIAGRRDQISFKLYATVDQGLRSKHAEDLRQLEPTRDQLLESARWTRTHDPSEGFRQVLVETLRAFGVEGADADI